MDITIFFRQRNFSDFSENSEPCPRNEFTTERRFCQSRGECSVKQVSHTEMMSDVRPVLPIGANEFEEGLKFPLEADPSPVFILQSETFETLRLYLFHVISADSHAYDDAVSRIPGRQRERTPVAQEVSVLQVQ